MSKCICCGQEAILNECNCCEKCVEAEIWYQTDPECKFRKYWILKTERDVLKVENEKLKEKDKRLAEKEQQIAVLKQALNDECQYGSAVSDTPLEKYVERTIKCAEASVKNEKHEFDTKLVSADGKVRCKKCGYETHYTDAYHGKCSEVKK